MRRTTLLAGLMSKGRWLAALALATVMVGPVATTSRAAATYTVNAVDDTSDDSCDATHCSLREAIAAANANPGIDTISFALTGSTSIQLTAALPAVTDPVVIDGTTQPGYDSTPVVVLDGSAAPAGTDGLSITAGGSTVRGLSIGNFSKAAVRLSGGGGNVLESNHLGVDAVGTTATPNGGGVVVLSADNVIGSTKFADGNVISGNIARTSPATSGAGVWLYGAAATGNQVTGNLIGVDAAMNGFNGNEVGVLIQDAPSNTVGVSTFARNYISGNQTYGVHVTGAGASGNTIQDNTIGGVFGGTGGDNKHEDVLVEDAPGTKILGNTIEINQIGWISTTTMITIKGTGASGTVLQGNQVTGNSDPSGPGDAVVVNDAPNTTIGGTAAGQGNAIGNAATCIWVSGPAAGSTVIAGNSIGRCSNAGVRLESDDVTVGPGNSIGRSAIGVDVASDGNAVKGNQILGSVLVSNLNEILGGGLGVHVSGDNNVIGGTTADARNIISGTAGSAGALSMQVDGHNNIVQGNFIGTNAAGTAAYVWSMMLQIPPYTTITVTGNSGPGIWVSGSDNLIGGPGLGAGGNCSGACNLVAASGGSGAIEITGSGNRVEGNAVGTDLTGTSAIANTGDGIVVSGATGATVQDNLVANSASVGIAVMGSQRAQLTQNRIRDNGGLGIDLQAAGEAANTVTPNDPGDGDIGPNLLQNYPVIATATSGASGSAIAGTLDSSANGTFAVELFATPACDLSGHGEGDRYLGSASTSTDTSGHGTFSAAGLPEIPPGWIVTATATDAMKNSSEFSACFAGIVEEDSTPPQITYTGNAGTYTVDQQVNITCTAADEAGGSGLASTTCVNVVGSAAGFGLGLHSYSATATDNAGNIGNNSTSFTVTVTPASLCNLTVQLMDGSAKYLTSTASQKAAINKTISAFCTADLTPIKPGIKPAAKAVLIAAYKLGVNVLAAGGWLSRAQATQLAGLTSGL